MRCTSARDAILTTLNRARVLDDHFRAVAPGTPVLAREELELARRFGAPRDRDRAAHDRRVHDELDALREAVDVLAHSPARLEHARALCDPGAALRHRRHIVDPARGRDGHNSAGSMRSRPTSDASPRSPRPDAGIGRSPKRST
jgi:hypothetical protein